MSKQEPIRAADVMQTEFDKVDGIKTIAEALSESNYLDNECIIVNPRNEDDEYGILLLSDIAKHVLAVDKSPHRVNVYEVMNKPVIGISPNMDVRYCSRLFHKFGLAVAPVIENREVLGLISYKTIILNGLLKTI